MRPCNVCIHLGDSLEKTKLPTVKRLLLPGIGVCVCVCVGGNFMAGKLFCEGYNGGLSLLHICSKPLCTSAE
jgi:hypothetical protein